MIFGSDYDYVVAPPNMKVTEIMTLVNLAKIELSIMFPTIVCLIIFAVSMIANMIMFYGIRRNIFDNISDTSNIIDPPACNIICMTIIMKNLHDYHNEKLAQLS